ncbi:MAG: hypothetical protein ACRC2R_16855 [Xenococcaceae cyanobacterium]
MACPEYITRAEFERRLAECCKPTPPPPPPPNLSNYCTKSECSEIRRLANNALNVANQALNAINAHKSQGVPGAHQWTGAVKVDVSLASSAGRILKLFTRVDVAGKSGNDSATVSITNLKGDKGDRGEKGAKGDKGDKGDKGEKGQVGQPGANGKDGKPGKDGVTRVVYQPDTQTKKKIDEIEKVNKECCDLIVNKINGVDSKLNGIIVTLAGMVAAILAGLKGIKLEINPEFNVKLDSIIGKLELTLKPILEITNKINLKLGEIEVNIRGYFDLIIQKVDSFQLILQLSVDSIVQAVNKIDVTIKGIELSIKGFEINFKGIEINFTGVKAKLDNILKIVNNFKVDFEPVFKVTNSLSLKLDNLLNVVNKLKFEVDFEPVFKITNNINNRLGNIELNIKSYHDSIYQKIEGFQQILQISIDSIVQAITTIDTRLAILNSLENNIVTKIKQDLTTINQNILSFRAFVQTNFQAVIKAIANLQLTANNHTSVINNINENTRPGGGGGGAVIDKLEELLTIDISPEFGDCVLIEQAEIEGEIVPEHKEYQIVETRNYTKLEEALYGLYDRFNSVQQNICELKVEPAETDCLVLLPDTNVYYNAGKFLTFSWVLESNPKVSVYQNHTQLRNPIPALQETPDPDTDYWGIYFNDKYKILGKQYARTMSSDSTKVPLIEGWFLNENEAMRFFNSMQSLTTSVPNSENNPRYPKVNNNTMHIENTGEKLILKRVCYAEKDANTDKLKKLHGWSNPNLDK